MTLRLTPIIARSGLDAATTELAADALDLRNIDRGVAPDRADDERPRALAIRNTALSAPPAPRASLMVTRLDRERFIAELTRDDHFGGFCLSQLSRADVAELERLGVDVGGLWLGARRDHELSGADELNTMFEALERLDNNGSSRSFNLSYRSGDDVIETRAGKALAILLGTLRRYDVQPQRIDDMRFVVVPDAERKAPVHLAVPALKQRTQTDCFVTNKRALDAFAQSLVQRATPRDRAAVRETAPFADALADATHFAARIEDRHGHIGGRREDFVALRAYVDACLARGVPAFVGVSHAQTDTQNWDRATDHSVMIVGFGYDASGVLYYEFNDPADGGTGRFLVDQASSMLVRAYDAHGPSRDDATETKDSYVSQRSYRVTMVRTWKQLPFESVTGRPPAQPAATFDGQPAVDQTLAQFIRG